MPELEMYGPPTELEYLRKRVRELEAERPQPETPELMDIAERLRMLADGHSTSVRSALLMGADEIERLRLATLTAAELKAVRTAAFAYAQNDDDDECAAIAAALLGLAERAKNA